MKCATRSAARDGSNCCWRRSFACCFQESEETQAKEGTERGGARGGESHEEVCLTERKKYVNYDRDHYEQ